MNAYSKVTDETLNPLNNKYVTIKLENGEQIKGKLLNIEEENITIKTYDGNIVKVKKDSINEATLETVDVESGYSPYAKETSIIVELNPIGFLIFGPQITFEYNLNKQNKGQFSIFLGAQQIGSGLLIKAAADEADITVSGFALQLGAIFYPFYDKKGIDSLYLSAFLQYYNIDVADDQDNNATLSIYGPMVGVGFRWLWTHFTMRFGGEIGYVTGSVDFTDLIVSESDKQTVEDAVTGIIYGINWSIGIAF